MFPVNMKRVRQMDKKGIPGHGFYDPCGRQSGERCEKCEETRI